jgi:hypothetical protein
MDRKSNNEDDNECHARDAVAPLVASAADAEADDGAGSRAERVAVSGSASAFRRFRHLLMAKHFESRDNVPVRYAYEIKLLLRYPLFEYHASHLLCI